MDLKECSGCKRELPRNTDYFFKRKDSKDGFKGKCKECLGNKFTNKLERHKNKGYRVCAKCGTEYKLNSDNFFRCNASQNGLKQSCKECDSKQNKEYKSKNKDKVKKQWKDWYKNNQESRKLYHKQYRKENWEYTREYNKNYGIEYRKSERGIAASRRGYHNRVSLERQLKSDFTTEEWSYCKDYFGNVCAYCGDDNKKITQDHFIPVSKMGNYTANNIIPCCFSCNSSKQDKDFYEWYITKNFYDKDKIYKIESYLNSFND